MNEEMHPYQFSRFELYLMDRLEKKFNKHELFTFNRWPKVYWGNRSEKNLNENITVIEYDPRYQVDLLGAYRYEVHAEGYIELYEDKIEESAKSISIKLGLDFELTFDLLRAKVLLHEIGHWLTHWCIIHERKSRQVAYNELAQDKNITETMAQLTVVWACKGLTNSRIKNLLSIMDFLADRQPPPYYQYKKLGKNQSKIATIQKRYLKLLDLINIDIEYLLFQKNVPDSFKSINMN